MDISNEFGQYLKRPGNEKKTGKSLSKRMKTQKKGEETEADEVETLKLSFH